MNSVHNCKHTAIGRIQWTSEIFCLTRLHAIPALCAHEIATASTRDRHCVRKR
jgi:hypothetical protein